MLSHSISTAKVPSLLLPARIAMLLFNCFIIAVIVLHFLRTDYDPLQRFISEYEVGAYSSIMRIAFYCLSVGSMALIVALYKNIVKSARLYIALTLLFVWSICVALAGIFPTDLAAAPATTSGNIHNNASLLGFVAIIAASFLLLRFRNDKNKKRFYILSLVLPVCLLLSFLAMMASVITEFIYIGLVQRIFITLVLLWLMRMAGSVLVIQKD